VSVVAAGERDTVADTEWFTVRPRVRQRSGAGAQPDMPGRVCTVQHPRHPRVGNAEQESDALQLAAFSAGDVAVVDRPMRQRQQQDIGNTQTIEVPRPVLEIDVTPYPRRTVKNTRSTGAAYEMAYAASITLMVTEPHNTQAHPQLIMAASLHRFAQSTAEHTLAGIKSIQERGWNPNRLTADRGKSVGLAPADFQARCRSSAFSSSPTRSRLGVRDASATRDAEAGAEDEWVDLYAHARHASESLSAHMQSTRGLQGRMHGLAAQSFVFTLTAAATNLGRINKFLSDCAACVQEPSKTPRKRDVEDRTHYRRWYTVPTVIRGQSTKEKRQAAAKRGKKTVAVAAN